MSSFVAQGNASGTGAHTLQSSATNSSITQTLPTVASTTLGYLNTPLDAKTASYTVVLGDSGKTILRLPLIQMQTYPTTLEQCLRSST
jgi:hypothetical protein